MLDYSSKSVKRWQPIVDDFNNSKLRPKEYCEQHNLSHKTLYNWRHINFLRHYEFCSNVEEVNIEAIIKMLIVIAN